MPRTHAKTPDRHVFSYEKKPIARAGRECLTLCQQIAAGMNKIYKYQLGADICRAGTNLASSIYLALDEMGCSTQKAASIRAITRNIMNLIVLVRVARDVNQVAQNHFESIINKIVSIKIQTENWLSFIEKETDKQNATPEN